MGRLYLKGVAENYIQVKIKYKTVITDRLNLALTWNSTLDRKDFFQMTLVLFILLVMRINFSIASMPNNVFIIIQRF